MKTTMATTKSGRRPCMSLSLPYSGAVAVAVSMKAVITHDRWASPPSSPTMRGSAVLTMFWSSEASAMVVNSPAKLRRKARRSARAPASPPAADGSGMRAPSLVSTIAIMPFAA